MPIKDLRYTLNTGELNVVETMTPKINGTIHAFVIQTKGADVRIEMEEWPLQPLVNLLNLAAPNGIIFYPHTQTSTGLSGKPDSATLWALNATKWKVNDKLRISISGAKNTEVMVMVRYE